MLLATAAWRLLYHALTHLSQTNEAIAGIPSAACCEAPSACRPSQPAGSLLQRSCH